MEAEDQMRAGQHISAVLRAARYDAGQPESYGGGIRVCVNLDNLSPPLRSTTCRVQVAEPPVRSGHVIVVGFDIASRCTQDIDQIPDLIDEMVEEARGFQDARASTREEFEASEYCQTFRASVDQIRSILPGEWSIDPIERPEQDGPCDIILLSGPSDNWRIDMTMHDLDIWEAEVHDVRAQQGEIRETINGTSGVKVALDAVAHIEWQMS